MNPAMASSTKIPTRSQNQTPWVTPLGSIEEFKIGKLEELGEQIVWRSWFSYTEQRHAAAERMSAGASIREESL
jgi:hypothetical protein